MANCKYCNDKGIEESFVYETKYWKVYLAYEQSYLGRCVVALKRHAESLSEVKKEELLDFIELVKKLETGLKKSFGATMFNWTCLMNDAYKEKNPIPHVHWHFRPRYKNNVEFAGVIFEDKEFGNHYDRKRTQIVSKEINKKIIDKIKENLKL